MVHLLLGFKYDCDAFKIVEKDVEIKLNIYGNVKNYELSPSIIFKSVLKNRKEHYEMN